MPITQEMPTKLAENQQVDHDRSLSLASSSDSETSNDIDLTKCVNVSAMEFKVCRMLAVMPRTVMRKFGYELLLKTEKKLSISLQQ